MEGCRRLKTGSEGREKDETLELPQRPRKPVHMIDFFCIDLGTRRLVELSSEEFWARLFQFQIGDERIEKGINPAGRRGAKKKVSAKGVVVR